PKLLDKLERTVAELEKEGHHVDHVFVMSGFRTPRYNKGGGNTGGRANLSRHMYGDASDVYVDNDRDGQPDDLNGDGRVDTQDAKIFADAAEKVEREYPALVGGIGIYKACCGHGPFTTSTPADTARAGTAKARDEQQGGSVTESLCPDCGSPRPDWTKVCPACGAPPEPEHRQGEPAGGVRAADLEPYITLRYIAGLFKVLAIIVLFILLGEVVTVLMIHWTACVMTLIGE